MLASTAVFSDFGDRNQIDLETLSLQRQELQCQLGELNARIARHPDSIAAAFSHVPGWDPQVLKVVSLQPVNGYTDSRKNMMPWSGFRFELDESGEVYMYRSGENWCDSFCEVAAENELGEGQSVYTDELEDSAEAPFVERVQALRRNYPDHVIVAMFLKQGVEG